MSHDISVGDGRRYQPTLQEESEEEASGETRGGEARGGEARGSETGGGETGGETGGGEACGSKACGLPELAKVGTRVVLGGDSGVVMAVTSTQAAVMYDNKKWEAIYFSQCRLA